MLNNKLVIDFIYSIIDEYIRAFADKLNPRLKAVRVTKEYLPDHTGSVTIQFDYASDYGLTGMRITVQLSEVAEILIVFPQAEAIQIRLPSFDDIDAISLKRVVNLYEALVWLALHPHLVPHISTFTDRFASDLEVDRLAVIAFASEYGSTYDIDGASLLNAFASESVKAYWNTIRFMFIERKSDEDADRPRKRKPLSY